MWDPTHVQVTVQKARGLLIKGKNGTNNCFVTIALGKEKFQTSVKHKATQNVEWLEECELPIPTQGNTAEVVLKVYDEDFVKDHLLGQVSIPLKDLDVYERPRNRWYKLQGKSGKENDKDRGEIEVKIAFTVKEGSLTDLSKKDKHRSSLSSLAQNVGGSLMSIGSIEKRKSLKKFAKNISSKMNLNNKKDKKNDSSSISGSVGNLKGATLPSPIHSTPKRLSGEADPGVISEDDDEFAFDDLSHKSSGSSLNVQASYAPRSFKYTPSPVNASLENLGGGEFLRRSTSSTLAVPEKSIPQKPVRLSLDTFTPPQLPTPVMDSNDEWSQKLLPRKSMSQLAIDREKSSSLERNKKLDSPSSLKEKPSPKFFKKFVGSSKPKKLLEERIIVGEENIVEEDYVNPLYHNIPKTVLQQFEGKTREDLIVMIYNLQKDAELEKKKTKDLENYLDELLLRVMETTPRILQNPYVRNNSMYIRNK
ncbi:rab11 family-interacting protein 2 isoform X2 [Bombyx mandarina]|uniref:Rab11 family-interacting protein 2 isoform X1 n=1 Tax=Bombyx mandarina TaxID=7092 RepID=A0A6J2JYQ6_BOMMA|nr:rab11 family-interacting protein 2 isoform X1 [Bombyx mandarina]XP_028035036.1 rab11 family-interacting protein 2 isoform X1 [Bombyx mandarina]XP_028035038.1 rab11 family-interacting protein 2 isoform X2 [Bombyx mandarina]